MVVNMADKIVFENNYYKVAPDTAERTPNSVVTGRGANHYPRAPAHKEEFI